MKDLVIPAPSIRREFWLLLTCLVLALLLNVYAIIAYQTQWSELFTTWRITLGLTLVLYALTALPRLCWFGLRKLWRRSKAKP